jgi:hypothetical protein
MVKTTQIIHKNQPTIYTKQILGIKVRKNINNYGRDDFNKKYTAKHYRI